MIIHLLLWIRLLRFTLNRPTFFLLRLLHPRSNLLRPRLHRLTRLRLRVALLRCHEYGQDLPNSWLKQQAVLQHHNPALGELPVIYMHSKTPFTPDNLLDS
jgi:hypothetical protein